MFQLTDYKLEYLRSQFVTANISSMVRSNPYVFTEQGIYMLMTVNIAVRMMHIRPYIAKQRNVYSAGLWDKE